MFKSAGRFLCYVGEKEERPEGFSGRWGVYGGGIDLEFGISHVACFFECEVHVERLSKCHWRVELAL